MKPNDTIEVQVTSIPQQILDASYVTFHHNCLPNKCVYLPLDVMDIIPHNEPWLVCSPQTQLKTYPLADYAKRMKIKNHTVNSVIRDFGAKALISNNVNELAYKVVRRNDALYWMHNVTPDADVSTPSTSSFLGIVDEYSLPEIPYHIWSDVAKSHHPEYQSYTRMNKLKAVLATIRHNTFYDMLNQVNNKYLFDDHFHEQFQKSINRKVAYKYPILKDAL